MKKIVFILTGLFLGTSVSQAQQLEQSNLYEFNKLKINPAYAGSEECVNITVGHLAQWVGFDGAPQTSYVNGSGQLGKNTGLGGRILLDRIGSLQRLNAQLAYAYKLNFGEDHNLRLGLAAGINQHSFNLSGSTIQDITDESIITGTQRATSFYSEAGLVYNLKNFQLSFSVPNLMETGGNLNPTTSGRITNSRHMVGYAGYRFGKPSKLTVTPSVLYKNGGAGEYQIEGNVLLNFKEIFQFGLGYRHQAGILGRVGLNVDNRFQIAYAYTYATTDISTVTSGSHQVSLGMRICKGNTKPIKTLEPEVVFKTDTVFTEPIVIRDTVVVEKLVEVKEEVKERLRLEHTIYYESGKSDIDAEKETAALMEIANYLKENKEQNIFIKGYASEEGSDYGNFKLSGERTKKVFALLLKLGVERNQMVSVVQGEVGEHHGGDSNEDQSKNRKVTVVFSN